MSTTRLMTTEELLAMPDDGVERWLINGELREGNRDVTRRSRKHSRTMTNVAYLLRQWLETQPEPRGEVLTGDAGFRLKQNPDVSVGIDVAYVSPELSAATPEDASIVEGAPVLAVEILSPSNTHEQTHEKLQAYLDNGVALVWLVDPDVRTVTVHRPDAEPVLFNRTQDLDAAPHLPGLRVPVAELFG